MGGIIRCIKNDYNLDQLENEINKTDPDSGFDEILKIIKKNNNAYIDIDDKKTLENNHYADNFLEKDYYKCCELLKDYFKKYFSNENEYEFRNFILADCDDSWFKIKEISDEFL